MKHHHHHDAKGKKFPHERQSEISPLVSATTTSTPRDLPVKEAEASIIQMVLKNSACIIVGETGSGKTTQIPQFVYDGIVKKNLCGGSHGIVGCTQPRRVAAVSIARHVAQQRGVVLGKEVGYAVRFDDKTSDETKIKFMTDGILLREIQSDPLLHKYSCILLDEAHERTLHGDVLFGLLKDITRQRPHDLKIVVMSATLNSKDFSTFWRDAPIGVVHGRSYPVTVFHAQEAQADYVEAAISTILQIHLTEPVDGDVLCFLTGQEEIEDSKRVLEHRLKDMPKDVPDYIVLPLYSAMPYESQLRVFDPPPPGVRKIILATNIAETSITVEGIKFVIDCGVVKAKSFNTRTGMETLAETDVSKAQATQRSGRAGRMSAGKCFRLYTESAFESLPDNTTPEITRCSLNSVVLQMKSIGITDVLNFEFMDKPPVDAIAKACDVLFLLGALDRNLNITKLGRSLTEFPIEPVAAKALLAGKALGAERDVLAMISMVATENIFVTSREAKDNADRCRSAFAKQVGDHATFYNIFLQYTRQKGDTERRAFCDANSLSYRQMLKVEDTLKQLAGILSTIDISGEDFGFANANSGDVSAPGGKRPRAEMSVLGDALTDDNDVQMRPKPHGDFELARRALCFGYFLNVAYFDAKQMQYITIVGRQVVHLHPTSVLFANVKKKPPLVLFNNVVETTKRFMKDVSIVQEQWLRDAAPLFFKTAA